MKDFGTTQLVASTNIRQGILCAHQRIVNIALQGCTSRLRLSSHTLDTSSIRPRHAASHSLFSGTGSVRAELQLVGVPDSTIDRTFTAYPSYRKWDLEAKFRPALQRWLQELGPQQFATQLHRLPSLLRRTPSQVQELCQWLTSEGVADAEKALKRRPGLLEVHLPTLQRKMDQIKAFNSPSVLGLVLRNPGALEFAPQRIYDTCNAMAQVLDLDVASQAMADLTTSMKSRRMFCTPATDIVSRMSAFKQHFDANQATTTRALRHGIFLIEPAAVQHRAKALQHMLDLTNEQLKRLLKEPALLIHPSEALQAHVDAFVTLGFSMSQLKAMFLIQPVLLATNMTTATMTEKWQFITCVLKLSRDAVASTPGILTYSLQTTLGPRHGYLLQLLVTRALTDKDYRGLQAAVYNKLNDVAFAARVGRFIKDSDLQYNLAFKAVWQQRWKLLTQQEGIALQEIGVQQQLLVTC